jgi:hypothetical protein
MTPLAAKLRESSSREWRRRSLVRVRRPAWTEPGSETARAPQRKAPQADVSSSKTHTTQDDISW